MPSIEKFKESLTRFGVDACIASRIDAGFDGITGKAPKKQRAAYFRQAVNMMAECLDEEMLRELFEWNACCKGGARERASKAYAKAHAGESIEERLSCIESVPNMGRAFRNEDGSVTIHAVSYWKDGRFNCACSNFKGLKGDGQVNRKYCFCCAGHFRHHYEIMLGIKLGPAEIVSSPLDSNGERPCVIRFEMIGEDNSDSQGE